MAEIFVSTVNTDDFHESFELPEEDRLEGDPRGKVHWLRQTDSPGAALLVGIFVGEPSAFRYHHEMNETIHILEGEVEIEIEGQAVTLGPGSVASFPKGAESVWRIKAPLRELFVLSG